MRLPEGKRSTEWVARLPAVVRASNGEVTRLTGKRPSEAIKAKTVTQKPSSTVPGRPVGLREQKLPSGVCMRDLHQPGELEGGRRRTTDPVWSLDMYRLGRLVTKPDESVLYYLQNGPPCGFVRKELLVVPPRHPTTAGWGSQALNSSSMYASISAMPAGIASLCP